MSVLEPIQQVAQNVFHVARAGPTPEVRLGVGKVAAYGTLGFVDFWLAHLIEERKEGWKCRVSRLAEGVEVFWCQICSGNSSSPALSAPKASKPQAAESN